MKSWSSKNLYNLWQRTVGPKSEYITLKFTSNATLFQQRWKSKAVVRAYHGDYINEKLFKRWYLPETIPDVRPRRAVMAGDDADSLAEYARRKARAQASEEAIAKKGMPPVGSLMFSEVERRIDTVVFRSCFAESIYEARRLVIHGDVLLNGKKVDCFLPVSFEYMANQYSAHQCEHSSGTWRHDLSQPLCCTFHQTRSATRQEL